MKRSRSARVAAACLTVFAVLGASAALGSDEERLRHAFEAEFQKHDFYREIKTYFPESYSAHIDELAAMASNGATPSELRGVAQNYTSRILADGAEHAKHAPDSALRDWLTLSAVYVAALEESVGGEICGKVMAGDPDYVPLGVARTQAEAGARAAAAMRAIGEGRRSNVAYPPLEASDEERFFAAVKARGFTDEDIEDAASRDTLNERSCGVLVAQFETLAEGDSASDVRLRGNFTPQMLASSSNPSD